MRTCGQKVKELWPSWVLRTKKLTAKYWPIFFFAVILNGLYFTWKLLSTSSDKAKSNINWVQGEEDHVVARAEYDIVAVPKEETSLCASDRQNFSSQRITTQSARMAFG
jgi:hypothetical protein